MDAGVEGIGRLLVLLVEVALPDDATEADLNMLARAPEPIIQFEVTERGVEIVLPHQPDGALAEPDTFASGGRTGHDAARLGDLVGPPRAILGFSLAVLGRLLLAILGVEGGEGSGCECRCTQEDCKETPDYTKHGRTIRFSVEADGDKNTGARILRCHPARHVRLTPQIFLSSMAELAHFVQPCSATI